MKTDRNVLHLTSHPRSTFVAEGRQVPAQGRDDVAGVPMRKFAAALIAASLAAAACAQAPAQPPLQPAQNAPRLLVVISVDQFSADLWDEYRPHLTGGLARLGSGVAFRNGFQSHATTETCLGHSTILPGEHPSRTGIVGNVWYDPKAPRTDKAGY